LSPRSFLNVISVSAEETSRSPPEGVDAAIQGRRPIDVDMRQSHGCLGNEQINEHVAILSLASWNSDLE